MKRWFLGTVVVLLLLAVVLAVTFPAALAWHWIADRAPGIKLQGLNGTLWSGEAARFSAGSNNLGRLKWTLSPWRLLRGEVNSQLNLDGPGIKMSALVRQTADGGLAITDLSGEAEAKWLGPALAIPVLEPSGTLSIANASATLDAAGLPQAVNAELVWRDAGVRGQVMARFGTITIASHGDGGRILTTIADSGDGELEVNGSATLDQRVYHSEIRLRARASEGPVVEALKWIGEASPDGGRLLIIDGHLLIGEKQP